jgi:hypothetical protein
LRLVRHREGLGFLARIAAQEFIEQAAHVEHGILSPGCRSPQAEA